MSPTESSLADKGEPEFIRSLAKGLAVIEAFGHATPAMTLSEIARRTNLTPASARRVLMTLQSLGYVGFDNRHFTLLPRALKLGFAYLSSFPAATLAMSSLAELARKLNASCSLTVLDGTEVVYVARAPVSPLESNSISIGARLPAYVTSGGKVLLAALDKEALAANLAATNFERITSFTLNKNEVTAALRACRLNGFAVNDQESSLGLRSIAVAISINGRTDMALSASTQIARASIRGMAQTYVPQLRSAAAAITELMMIQGQTARSRIAANEPPPPHAVHKVRHGKIAAT